MRILHRSGGHAEFVRRAAHHGIEPAVIAGPAIPPGAELADYYGASDVCVQASREEGLGFSPLEALACRVPIAAKLRLASEMELGFARPRTIRESREVVFK